MLLHEFRVHDSQKSTQAKADHMSLSHNVAHICTAVLTDKHHIASHNHRVCGMHINRTGTEKGVADHTVIGFTTFSYAPLSRP